jgi:hypothetical protein
MLDMSTALGQDVSSSAIQLGKALNDPVNGITALSRVGVSFSEDQKAVIEALVEMGDTAGAQKLILEELNKEFGGSAQAAGKTFAGKLKILNNQLGELKENIGNQLLPIVSDLATAFTGLLSGDMDTKEFADQFDKGIDELVKKIEEVLPTILDTSLAVITTALPDVATAGVGIASELVSNFLKGLPDLVDAGAQTITSVIDGIGKELPTLLPEVTTAALDIVDELVKNLPEFIDSGTTLFKGLIDGISNALPDILLALPGLVKNIVDGILLEIPVIIQGGIDLLTSLVEDLPGIIDGIAVALPALVSGIVSGVMDNVDDIIQGGINLMVALVKDVPAIINGISAKLPEIIFGVVKALLGIDNTDKMKRGGIDLFSAVTSDTEGILGELGKPLPGIVQGLSDLLSEQLDPMTEVGREMWAKLLEGLIEAMMKPLRLLFPGFVIPIEIATGNLPGQQAEEALLPRPGRTSTPKTNVQPSVPTPRQQGGTASQKSPTVDTIGNAARAVSESIKELSNDLTDTRSASSRAASSAPQVSAIGGGSDTSRMLESVVNAIAGMSGGQSGSSEPIVIKVEIDGKTLAQAVYQPLQDVSKQQGTYSSPSTQSRIQQGIDLLG